MNINGCSGKEILGYDVLINILKRVPVKSLIRFRCVAKDWANLFKTPYFIAQHLHHSSHNNPFLLLHRVPRFYPEPEPEPTLISCFLLVTDTNLNPNIVPLQNPPLMNFRSFTTLRIVGSSNGLLCLRHSEVYGDDDAARDHREFDPLSIWNPATREIRQVPGSRTSLIGLSDFYYVAFGFSPTVNNYKIVRISVSDAEFDDDENRFVVLDNVRVNRAEVYSLGTGRWKEIDATNLQTLYLVSSNPVDANGAVFWQGTIVRSDNSEFGDPEPDPELVVSFDIALEVFTLLRGPPASATRSHSNKLAVFKNKLAMFHHFILGNFESSSLDLWVMEDTRGETWTKMYSVGPFSRILHPVSIWRDEIVCREELPGHVGGYCPVQTVLSLFNPCSNELKNLPARRDEYHYVPFNHVESLVPVANFQLE